MKTLSSPDEHRQPEQHNYGPGTVVGRDYYKIETLDRNTKDALKQLSKTAPGLKAVVDKALRDGIISPEAVLALATAARNINEDVANALWHASRCINEDVASSLISAAKNINEGVADRIANASSQLAKDTKNLEEVLARIQGASGTVQSANANAHEWQRAAKAMDDAAQNMIFAAQMRDSANEGWSLRSFLWGAGVCFVVLVALLTWWGFALQ